MELVRRIAVVLVFGVVIVLSLPMVVWVLTVAVCAGLAARLFDSVGEFRREQRP